ncbi:MAG: hypothetical protein DWB99_04615 [Candidatus Poseidoniales archaeon]|nr:MAG: hypothetical protein DWB99_04615 [Candidatus Poseidoniales archaeon]|tara:strand:+ start:1975 stop:2490 length:516 start_codon:yes stop_codon:yes gene_type:complete
MVEDIQRVFVPSVTEEDGGTIGLGCFSTEKVAWEVLRTFLKRSEEMLLTSSSVVVWDIDRVGEEAMNVLATMECKDCPVCSRRTFWIDLENFSALCHGSACSAWIEENTVDPEIIDCGWPTIRFLKQNKSIEEAVRELYKLGDRLRAAGVSEQNSVSAEKLMQEHLEQSKD